MGKKPKRKLSAYNKHMSREMKKGRTFKQAVASWKGSKKPSRKTTSRRRTTTKGGRATVGRKQGFSTQKLFKYVRLAALVAPTAAVVLSKKTNYDRARYGTRWLTGYDFHTGKFSLDDLAKGWLPYLASVGVTYGIPKIAGMIRGL